MDPAWYLAPSPREAETRLGRTVLSALGCRYQPAQLNPTAMTQQLKEAEVLDPLRIFFEGSSYLFSSGEKVVVILVLCVSWLNVVNYGHLSKRRSSNKQ